MRIQEFKVIYICPDHNEKYHQRKRHMDQMLATLGFKDIVHYKSGTEVYPDCLSIATINILEENMNIPFLLLEDDVEFTGVDTVNIDEGVDAIYLGLSVSGGSKTENLFDGSSQYIAYSESQVRIQNMLSGHAILYISSAYKQAVIDTLKAHMGQKYYNDVLMSRLQPNFMILANKAPSFFQSAKFNRTDHEERHTRITFP
jgi:hypothetical protein